jgi:hypothetical protein
MALSLSCALQTRRGKRNAREIAIRFISLLLVHQIKLWN